MADFISDLVNLCPEDDDSYVKSNKWSASSLGRCYRIQLLEALGFRIRVSDNDKRKFAIANSIHDAIEDMLIQKYQDRYTIDKEVSMSNSELSIGGRADIVLHDR